MPVYLAVAIGGALGAVGRYGLDRLLETHTESVFPWSTLVINVTGSFAIGLFMALVVDRGDAPSWLRAGLVVGLVGGYTTFSTFAQETLDLLEEGRLGLALAYVGASVLVGVFAVVAGLQLGRAL